MRSHLRILLPALILQAFTVAAQAQNFAIVDARIEIGDGRVIEKGTVLIKDGSIEAVGANVEVKPEYTKIAGAGMTIYPGFIDGYSTRGLKLPEPKAPATPPDSTLTAPPTMWDKNRKGLRPELEVVKALDLKAQVDANHKQGITLVHLAPGGATLRGITAIAAYTPEPKVVNGAFGQEISFRGGAGAGYPGNILGVIALLRQTLYDAQTYSAQPSPQKDEAIEALVPLVQHKQAAVFSADIDREIQRAFNIADEFDLRAVINGGRDAYMFADELKSKNIPVVLNISSVPAPSTKPGDNPADGPPEEVLKERYAQWEERNQAAAKLNSAGVMLAFSSVGDMPAEFLNNVRKLITAGLPREAALKALTINAAKIFGIDNRYGTVEAGKSADLVIMSGDFAKSDTAVKGVFAGGTYVDLSKGTN